MDKTGIHSLNVVYDHLDKRLSRVLREARKQARWLLMDHVSARFAEAPTPQRQESVLYFAELCLDLLWDERIGEYMDGPNDGR